MPPSVSAETRAVLSPHSTETSDREWSADDVEASIPNDVAQSVLEDFYAFRNEDGDPDTKSAYDFIHHFNSDGEVGAASTRAASNAIAILNGGRGVDPTDQVWSDSRQGIYEHMVQHLEDAGRDPDDIPDLESRSDAQKRYEERTEARGDTLGSLLSNKIEFEIQGTESNQSEVLDDVAQETGRSLSVLRSVLNGEVECPPVEVLEGFAQRLRMDVEDLMAAGNADGCNYSPGQIRSNGYPSFKTRSQITEFRNNYEDRTEGKERRSFQMVEVRAEMGDEPRIDGHAAAFNEPTVINTPVGEFREVVKETAFDRVLNERDDVRYLINHDENKLMGRVGNGTLNLSKTSKGLRYENTPPDTSYADDALKVISRGDMNESSFGFDAEEENWIEGPGDMPTRELHSVKLYDVSSVTFPAYSGTNVNLRAEFRSLEADLGINLKELSSLLTQSRSGQIDDESRNRINEIISSIQNQISQSQSDRDVVERRKRELELKRRSI